MESSSEGVGGVSLGAHENREFKRASNPVEIRVRGGRDSEQNGVALRDCFPLPHEGVAVLDREEANASGGNELVPILVIKTNPQGAFRRQIQENLQEGKPAIGRFRLNDHALVVCSVGHVSYD